MTLSATTIWLIIATVLGIVELIATTFYLLVLAAGALVGAGAAWFGLSLEWQIALFALVAIIGSVWVRRIRSIPTKSDAQAHALQNLDEGQIVEVDSWNEAGIASVNYRGARWQARAIEGEQRTPGIYVIVRVEGSVLFVKKLGESK